MRSLSPLPRWTMCVCVCVCVCMCEREQERAREIKRERLIHLSPCGTGITCPLLHRGSTLQTYITLWYRDHMHPCGTGGCHWHIHNTATSFIRKKKIHLVRRKTQKHLKALVCQEQTHTHIRSHANIQTHTHARCYVKHKLTFSLAKTHPNTLSFAHSHTTHTQNS